MNQSATVARTNVFIRGKGSSASAVPTGHRPHGHYVATNFKTSRASMQAAPRITQWTTPNPQSSSLKGRFRQLAKRWRAETATMSSLQDAFLHQAYQQIIGMGPVVLPFLFEELKSRPAYWFWAIDAILGHDVLPHNFQGNFDAAVSEYLKWWAARTR